MAGCRKRFSVIILVLDRKYTRLWTRQACYTKRRPFHVNVWEIHRWCRYDRCLCLGCDSKLNHYMKEKSLEGMFALIKQRMNCKLKVKFNSEQLVTWLVRVWSYTFLGWRAVFEYTLSLCVFACCPWLVHCAHSLQSLVCPSWCLAWQVHFRYIVFHLKHIQKYADFQVLCASRYSLTYKAMAAGHQAEFICTE